MTEQEAVKIAVEAIQSKSKELYTYFMRYEREPEKWPELKKKHERYINMVKAMEMLEGMARQRRLFG